MLQQSNLTVRKTGTPAEREGEMMCRPPRSWKTLSAIGLVFLAPAASAQISPEFSAAEGAYEKCASGNAQRFATGSDAADLIAKAATEACRSQMQAMAQSLQREGQSSAFVVSAVEQINSDLVKKLKLLILEWRVKK
jgi:cytolysin (calcineurin-like family phosphatase)